MSQVYLRIWTFRCAQCRKIKETPFGTTLESWSPALKRKDRCLCSLACARAWDAAHEKPGPSRFATSGRVYTPEEDDEIVRLHDDGLTWAEIGRRLGRSTFAVANRYNNALSYNGRPIAAG